MRGLLPTMLLLAGCATAHYAVGTPVDPARVSDIEKGVTTAAQLVEWFGEPSDKSPVEDDGESWTYVYINTTSHATSGIFVTNATTNQQITKLELLLRRGVVVNYTFTDNASKNDMVVTPFGVSQTGQ